MAAASANIGFDHHTLTIPNGSDPVSTSGDPAEVGYWVRVLSAEERRFLRTPQTGDVLPDGAVLLKEDDISRMGLNNFRNWIVDRIIHERKPVVMLPSGVPHAIRTDED